MRRKLYFKSAVLLVSITFISECLSPITGTARAEDASDRLRSRINRERQEASFDARLQQIRAKMAQREIDRTSFNQNMLSNSIFRPSDTAGRRAGGGDQAREAQQAGLIQQQAFSVGAAPQAQGGPLRETPAAADAGAPAANDAPLQTPPTMTASGTTEGSIPPAPESGVERNLGGSAPGQNLQNSPPPAVPPSVTASSTTGASDAGSAFRPVMGGRDNGPSEDLSGQDTTPAPLPIEPSGSADPAAAPVSPVSPVPPTETAPHGAAPPEGEAAGSEETLRQAQGQNQPVLMRGVPMLSSTKLENGKLLVFGNVGLFADASIYGQYTLQLGWGSSYPVTPDAWGMFSMEINPVDVVELHHWDRGLLTAHRHEPDARGITAIEVKRGQRSDTVRLTVHFDEATSRSGGDLVLILRGPDGNPREISVPREAGASEATVELDRMVIETQYTMEMRVGDAKQKISFTVPAGPWRDRMPEQESPDPLPVPATDPVNNTPSPATPGPEPVYEFPKAPDLRVTSVEPTATRTSVRFKVAAFDVSESGVELFVDVRPDENGNIGQWEGPQHYFVPLVKGDDGFYYATVSLDENVDNWFYYVTAVFVDRGTRHFRGLTPWQKFGTPGSAPTPVFEPAPPTDALPAIRQFFGNFSNVVPDAGGTARLQLRNEYLGLRSNDTLWVSRPGTNDEILVPMVVDPQTGLLEARLDGLTAGTYRVDVYRITPVN